MRIIRSLTTSLPETLKSKYVTFNDGTAMPLVGLGTFKTGDQYAVERAIRFGYRLIDTACMHRNETFIGLALERVFQDPIKPVRRKDVFIVSKMPHFGYKDVNYFLLRSLSELCLNYVDLYLMHSPLHLTDTYQGRSPQQTEDEDFNILEGWKNMEKAVFRGYVRNIGLSNFSIRQIGLIYEKAQILPANAQIECHPFLPQWELQEFCKERNITLTAFSPLGAPYLQNMGYKVFLKFFPTYCDMLLHPLFLDLARKHRKTPAQIILRWLIQRGIAVVPKSIEIHHQQENVNIFDFTLSAEDETLINNICRAQKSS